MRASSFKAQYRRAPPRSATPPPPAYEPLSPILRPATPSPANPTGGVVAIAEHASNSINGVVHQAPVYGDIGRAAPPLGVPTIPSSPALRVAPPPALPHQNLQYSPVLRSPIDALANAALSAHGSPTYINSSHRPSYGLPSPTTAIPLLAPNQGAPKHTYPDETVYSYSERPSKRARSEYLPSPQFAHHPSRPSTSHVPSWSYNVEQMADSGVRMYQDNSLLAQPQEEASLKRLSDAQLLLDFAVTAQFSFQPTVPTRHQWSHLLNMSGSHPLDGKSSRMYHCVP